MQYRKTQTFSASWIVFILQFAYLVLPEIPTFALIGPQTRLWFYFFHAFSLLGLLVLHEYSIPRLAIQLYHLRFQILLSCLSFANDLDAVLCIASQHDEIHFCFFLCLPERWWVHKTSYKVLEVISRLSKVNPSREASVSRGFEPSYTLY